MEATMNGTASDVDQISERLGRIKNDIKEVVGLARTLAADKISGIKGSAIESGKAAVGRVSDHIEENPMRSALIAAGVGAVIGYLLSRR
jgi:ElaB/YqjD/DUF883 family membrane-anchored ribosome-binding protein